MADRGEDLLRAVRAGDAGRLAQTLADGADPNVGDALGVTALGHAAARGDLAAAEQLIAAGARLDGAGDAGNTPLMLAAARGQVEMVGYLLEKGADPTAANKWGLGARDWGRWSGRAAEINALLTAR